MLKIFFLRTKLGVRQPGYNNFLVGNNPLSASLGLGKENSIPLSRRQYNEFAGEKYYGTYGFGLSATPILMVRDLDLIRHVVGMEHNAHT